MQDRTVKHDIPIDDVSASVGIGENSGCILPDFKHMKTLSDAISPDARLARWVLIDSCGLLKTIPCYKRMCALRAFINLTVLRVTKECALRVFIDVTVLSSDFYF